MKLLRLGLNLLAVLGLGLAMATLSANISVAPAPADEGREAWPLSWTRRLALGEPLRVQGSLPAGVDSVALSDPAGVVVRARPAPEFELRALPRAVGRFLYKVEAEPASGVEGASRLVDVEVIAPPALKVLWLEGAPRFESKFFKAWASRLGSSVALRSTISLDREREEFSNQARADLSRLDRESLGNFDLLVLDEAVLARLSTAEAAALRQAVELDGLGVLLLTESMLDNVLGTKLGLERAGDLEERSIRLRPRPGAADRPAGPLPGPALQIQPLEPWNRMEQDSQGLWVGAWTSLGRGRLGVSLLRSTYRWVLEGTPELHADYWASWTGCLARPLENPEEWSVEASGAIWLDRPLSLSLATRQDRPRASIAGDRLALWQASTDPFLWRGVFWPGRTGWHQVGSGAGSAWFYVQPPPASRLPSSPPALPAGWPSPASSIGLALLVAALFGLWLLEK